jgi:membrane-associated phospholipid phosphatase
MLHTLKNEILRNSILIVLTVFIFQAGRSQDSLKLSGDTLMLPNDTVVVKDTVSILLADDTVVVKEKQKEAIEDVLIKDTVEHHPGGVVVKYVLPRGYHLSFWGAGEDPDNFDIHVFRSINGNRTKFKDSFFPIMNATFTPTVIGMAPLTYSYGKLSKTQYDENTAYLLAGAEITNFTITFALKKFTARLRPYLALRNVYYRLIRGESAFSFPSGHASYTFCIATMFTLRYSKYPYVYLPLCAWAFIVSYARSYFGLHYPVDIMSGAAIGILSASLVYAFRVELLNSLPGDTREVKPDYKSALAVVGAFLTTSAFGNFIYPLFKKKDHVEYGLNISPYLSPTGTGMSLQISW